MGAILISAESSKIRTLFIVNIKKIDKYIAL